MVDVVVPADPSAQGAPSFTHNLFMNAISSGSLQSVIQHINHEPDLVNEFGWHRQTALHRACMVGSVDIVKYLLDLGADPNARNNFNETPLHYACKRGLPPVLHCLLEKGGDITLTDKLGKDAVHHAAEGGSVHTLHMLKCRFPDVTFTQPDANFQRPLHLAIKGGKLDAFKYLIKQGRSDLRCPDKDGNWPIHLSTQEGLGQMTWMLLCVHGLSALHVSNNKGYTPSQLVNMYDTPRHSQLASVIKWQAKQSEGSNPKQHAYLLWFYYLLLPVVSFGAAVIITRFLPGFHILVFVPAASYIACTMRTSFHRLNHVSGWPHPIFAGTFAGGIFHTLVVYFYVMLPYMSSYPVLKLSSFFLAVVLVAFYAKLMTKDPGISTSPAQNKSTGKQLTFLDVCTSDEWSKFCGDCEMVMAPTTKHCKLCERCMMGMDHHCLFLLRCVASGNHTLFVYFMILVDLCMVLFIVGVIIYVCEVYSALPWMEVVEKVVSRDAWLLMLFLMNCVSAVWVGSMLWYQYHIVKTGHTQYFKPKMFSSDDLSCYEKLMNVAYFLLNRPPYVTYPKPSSDFKERSQVI
ncbi:uncharacterized protein [Littorina saxatilis]|uniref:Palmitoyltransferase n=1 Tax=Littorina saxatilis TaxID=31220 RepID=A0AAN9BS81_9CAEN